MRNNTFRHKVASSMLTLPVVAVAAAAVWLLPDVGNPLLAGGYALALVQAYMLMELNNRHQLLRIRSRLVSSAWLALAAACPFLHEASWLAVPCLCLTAAYMLLFRSYQRTRPEGYVFYAFAAVACGALVFPPLLALLPLLYVSMGVQLRSLTWRSFAAGLFGLAAPLLLALTAALYAGRVDWLAGRVEPFLHPALPPDYAATPLWQRVDAAFLGLLVLLALVHYYRTNFNDKIRVRMCHYAIILVELALVAGLCLLPQHFTQLYALLLVNSAPLVAHYFALARGGRWMNAWFVFWLVALAALGAYNYGLLPLPH